MSNIYNSLLNVKELRFLWKRRGKKDYNLQGFVISGSFVNYMILEDSQNRRKLLGKIVTSPREGEAYHWPRIQHENLVPLLDIASINEKISVYIFPSVGISMKSLIHTKEFLSDPQCFNRKRAYAKDILLALDYLHNKSLCIMNLTELIVYISDTTDKAIISDFHGVHLIKTAKKEDLELPVIYRAPELKTGNFDPVTAQMWACGVMFLEIFTTDALPSAFVGEEVRRVLQAVQDITYDIIKDANIGAEITFSMVAELKSFLNLFLVENPKDRVDLRKAIASKFLKNCRPLEVKDDLEGSLWRSNLDVNRCQALDKSKWIKGSHKKQNLLPFEDIYLEEVANYKNKLKEAPFTNKFINLDFVPVRDNIETCRKRSTFKRDEETEKTHCAKLKPIVEHFEISEIISEHKLNKSVIGDNEVTMADIDKNFTSPDILNNTSVSNFKIMSTDFENAPENDKKTAQVYHIDSVLHKKEDKSNISNLETLSNNFSDVTRNIVKKEGVHETIPALHSNEDNANISNLETSTSDFKSETENIAKNEDVYYRISVLNKNEDNFNMNDLKIDSSNFKDEPTNAVKKEEVRHTVSVLQNYKDNSSISNSETPSRNFKDAKENAVKNEGMHPTVSVIYNNENNSSISDLEVLLKVAKDAVRNAVKNEVYYTISALHDNEDNSKNSNLEILKSNFKGNVESAAKNEGVSHTVSVLHNNEDNSNTEISSSNFKDMTGNAMRSEGMSQTASVLYSNEDNQAHISESSPEYLSDSNISLDSLEFPRNKRDKMYDPDLEFLLEPKTETNIFNTIFSAKSGQSFATKEETSCTKSTYIKSDFRTEIHSEQNILNDRYSFIDSCRNKSKHAGVSDFLALVKNDLENNYQVAENKHKSEILHQETELKKTCTNPQIDIPDDATTLNIQELKPQKDLVEEDQIDQKMEHAPKRNSEKFKKQKRRKWLQRFLCPGSKWKGKEKFDENEM